ncbi:MAG TPA: AAA family ATPase [Actinophytocola sp.]|uniref:MinD/ParA family ATP-binding protein n=1 Tax=Actinophytocola sp. TaxID=1872138 RepID=UPI002DDD092B|nr:AAA family ATPase [Actinophytocola sp.]HEV2778267.1 AAA family ATPase [Actinophytocola sp.]
MSGRQDETHDFGPSPTPSHLEEESKTDATAHPVPPQPSGQQSGPYQVPPEQSGPHSGPYSVAGPHSGPYSVGGPHSGPYSVGGGPSGPQHVDPATSGGYPVPQYQPGYAPVPGAGYAQYQHRPGYTPAQQPPGRGPVHADELSSSRLIKQGKRKPQSGWRKAVFIASGHLINPGEAPADLRRRELIARVNQPLRGCYKIAMLSLKGGVGKTTTTTTLGSTFASLRGDRVIAVDANPDRGTLSQKIPLETTATVRHLLRDADRIKRYSDIRAYTSQGPSRLEVLASEQDPAVSEAFSEDDYRRTITLLEHFYNIVLTDCGTGLMHSAMKGVLELADTLVVVSSGSVDGARSASATLDWLDAHGYRDLVARSVAVINSVRPKSGSVDLDKLAAHFGSRCRAVCRIPFDEHLEEGAEIELDRLRPETRMALLEMAATVADGFPSELRGR